VPAFGIRSICQDRLGTSTGNGATTQFERRCLLQSSVWVTARPTHTSCRCVNKTKRLFRATRLFPRAGSGKHKGNAEQKKRFVVVVLCCLAGGHHRRRSRRLGEEDRAGRAQPREHVHTPANIESSAMPLRFTLGGPKTHGRPFLSVHLIVKTARSERERPEF
jgi:hypothetical protein